MLRDLINLIKWVGLWLTYIVLYSCLDTIDLNPIREHELPLILLSNAKNHIFILQLSHECLAEIAVRKN
jgi:hypothetical protein